MCINDRIEQLETEIAVLKDNLLNYICQAVPKDADPQWTETRLRKLEEDVRAIKNLLGCRAE